MLDELGRTMQEWVRTVAPAAAISLEPPGRIPADADTVGVYLLDALPAPPARTMSTPPHQLLLRYVITAWSRDPQAEHRLLGDLAFAALEHADFEVEPEALPAEVWRAFGVAPRPCLVLRVPLRKPRAAHRAPLVRRPVVVTPTSIGALRGLVLGPEDVPVVGARVDLPASKLSTRTDERGYFAFRGVPTEPLVKSLRVSTRWLPQPVSVEHRAGAAEPLVIRLPAPEA